MTRWKTLHTSFAKYLGKDALRSLRESVTPAKIVTIGGDQLTGKSTRATNIAEEIGGNIRSTGETLREEADRRNVSIAEMCRLAKNDLTIDLSVDFQVCRALCAGDSSDRTLVIQGRLPAALATMAMEDFGKPASSVYRIYLRCSIVEQTLRFISREIGEVEHSVARRELDGATFESLGQASDAVASLPLAEATKSAVLREFVSNQTRDDDDRERFEELYGSSFDYRDSSMYDIEIDTSDIPSEETFARALRACRSALGV